MITSRILILLLAALSSAFYALPAQAGNKYVFVMGGEGDPPGDTTIFDAGIKTFAEKSRAAGWIPRVAFDGSHSKTAELTARAFDISPKARADFTGSEMGDIVGQILKDIRTGRIKKGDSVLLFVDGHGAKRHMIQDSHSVACTYGLCSLDILGTAMRALEAKGVRVALIDLSCYSGASLALSSPKSCVIADADADSVSYTNIAERFVSALLPGRSLDNAFKEARASDFMMTQISSPTGKKAREILQAFVGGIDAQDPAKFVEKQCAAPSCSSSPKGPEILGPTFRATVSDVDRLTGYAQDYPDLAKAIRKYREMLAKAVNMNNFVNAHASDMVPTPKGSLDWVTLASDTPEHFLKFAQEFEALEAHPTASNAKLRSQKEAELKRLQWGVSIRDRIIRENPNFRKFAEYSSKLSNWLGTKTTSGFSLPDKSESPLYLAADDLLARERATYEDLYAKIQKTSREPDPCRDFKF